MEHSLSLDLNWIIGLILHIIFVSTCVGLFLYFFKKKKEKKGDIAENFFLRLAFFFLIMGISYITRIIFVFIIPPNLDSFYQELVARTVLTQAWSYLQSFILFIAVVFLSLIVESTILKKKTHYLIALLIVITPVVIFILTLLLDITYKQSIMISMVPNFIALGVMGLFVAAYIYIGLKNAGNVRFKSIAIAIGLMLFTSPLIINSQAFVALLNLSHIITLETLMILAPLLLNISLVLLYFGYKESK